MSIFNFNLFDSAVGRGLERAAQRMPRRVRGFAERLVTPAQRGLKPSSPSQLSGHQVGSLEAFAWWLVLGLTAAGSSVSLIRHFMYLTPFLLFFPALANRKFYLPAVSFPFMFIVGFGLMLWPLGSKLGYKDLFFIFSGVSVVLMSRVRPMNSVWLLLLFAASQVVSTGWAFALHGLPGSFAFNPLLGESFLESSFSFNFGLLAVYFMLRGERRMAWWAVIGMLITIKRIAVMGVLLALPLVLMPEVWRKRLVNPVTAILANLAFVVMALAYGHHQLDESITQLTGMSANQFGQGRQALYQEIALEVLDDPLRYIAVGKGPGASYNSYRSELADDERSTGNLHSDVLKIFYEYGAVALCVFIWLMYRHPDSRVRILMMFANIMFLTDNVLIYHFVIFFVCQLGVWLGDSPLPAPRASSRSLRARRHPWADTRHRQAHG